MNPKRGSVHWIDTDGTGLDPMDPPVVVNPTPEKDVPRWEASEAASQLCQLLFEAVCWYYSLLAGEDVPDDVHRLRQERLR